MVKQKDVVRGFRHAECESSHYYGLPCSFKVWTNSMFVFAIHVYITTPKFASMTSANQGDHNDMISVILFYGQHRVSSCMS